MKIIDPDDRKDQICTECWIGHYQETTIHDDWDGVLHCTNKKCNHEVRRYKSGDNPPPKPEMVELSPAAQTVLDAGLGRDSDRLVIAAALLAAVEQVLPKGSTSFYLEDYEFGVWDARDDARSELIAIANELGGALLLRQRC
jgi:hypothetical protein